MEFSTNSFEMSEFDVVIIGAGHNGLTLGAYLSKAGLRVLLIDRRHEIGGGLCTEEVTVPGFRHNLHSIYHMMTDVAPIFKDLNLATYGVSYVFPPTKAALPLTDGRCLMLHDDVERTCGSIAKFSEKDADSYRTLSRKFEEYMNEIIIPATYVPPSPPLDLSVRLSEHELGREFLDISEKSALQIVNESFEDEHVKTLMLYLACCWGLGYDEDGLGFMAILYMNRATRYSLCVGGSHRLSSALSKIILRGGGLIQENEEVSRIVVKDGAATGVELKSGEQIASKAVASSIDAPQTFLQLVGEDHFEADLASRLKQWKWEETSLFAVHVALREAAKYDAAKFDPAANEAMMCILGYNGFDDLLSHWRRVYDGKADAAGGNCICPTLYDPSQAPSGGHTGLFETHAPYRLGDGGPAAWDKLRQGFMDECLAKWSEYAPNMKGKNILGKYAYTPLDIERKLTDMVEGSIKQGAYTPLQMGYFRPDESCSQYATPIKRLYLCGSSVYPGGMITAAPGYNAAAVIAQDLGISPWWSPPDYVQRARQKNLI
ncbi:MAG: phytoene desaturase family protein [Candidatus Bathyarchaeia archaeon]